MKFGMIQETRKNNWVITITQDEVLQIDQAGEDIIRYQCKLDTFYDHINTILNMIIEEVAGVWYENTYTKERYQLTEAEIKAEYSNAMFAIDFHRARADEQYPAWATAHVYDHSTDSILTDGYMSVFGAIMYLCNRVKELYI